MAVSLGVAIGVGVAVGLNVAVGVGVAIGAGVVVGVGSTIGTIGWAGVVATVAPGEGVGFGVSNFGTGVETGTTVAIGVLLGGRVGAGVTDPVGVEVEETNDDLTGVAELN